MEPIERVILKNGESRAMGWLKFHKDHLPWMKKARTDHHNYEGGYYDHVLECLEMARTTYNSLTLPEIPFSLLEALIALYFHDIEVMWKTTYGIGEWDILETLDELPIRYGFQLSKREIHAIYCHNMPDERRRLGSFVHAIDVMATTLTVSK